jgi:hypothetical protein
MALYAFMKKSLIIVGASLLLVASCTRSAEGQLPTPEMLSDALPTITEMPGEWNESQRQVFAVRGNENPSIDPSVWCPNVTELTKNLVSLAGDSGADVEMQAVMPEGQPRMMRLQAWANDDVKAYFRDAKEAVEICNNVEVKDAVGVTEKYSVIEDRDIGDQSISWQQTTTPPASTQTEKFQTVGRTTIARFGSIIMVLQLGDMAFTGKTNAMNEDDWWDIVELAGKKLDTLDEQVHK